MVVRFCGTTICMSNLPKYKTVINMIVLKPSFIINITAVVLSAMGILTPVTGALWHNFGSVFVVVNAALLLRVKDENE